LKVANIPLVVDITPPKELLDPSIDCKRVFCLTIAPSELRKIRTNRLQKTLGGMKIREQHQQDDSASSSSNTYADRNYLLKDLANARQLSQQYNWTTIDVTGRAVEETATYIAELYNERFSSVIRNNNINNVVAIDDEIE
jgi:regulator of PEP synthase PpsR (kinase-PPPase family)